MVFSEVEEVSEGISGWFRKRRRKRSVMRKDNSLQKSGSAIIISEDKANSKPTARSKRAADICFTYVIPHPLLPKILRIQ